MSNRNPLRKPGPDPLSAALRSMSGSFFLVGIFSLFCNIAMLVVPLYMLQIYDRVLTSGSKDTLLLLTALALGLLLLNALLELSRARMLVRIGAKLDSKLSARLFAASFGARLSGSENTPSEPLRDFEKYRTFLTGPGIIALFDAPWTPIYLGIIFVLHPILGGVALSGAVVIGMLALLSEFYIRGAMSQAGTASRNSTQFTEVVGRNVEAVHAMGMLGALTHRWLRAHDHGVAWQAIASDRMAVLQAIAKFVRMALQIAILGIGAWLALEHQLSAGSIVAGSIIMGRALAPVETMIGQWRSLVAARQARRRLKEVFALSDTDEQDRTQLPAPGGHVRAEHASLRHGESREPVLANVTFELLAGEVLGIIGPSGAGKSTLARLIVGLREPTVGNIRLDGADVATWPKKYLGNFVGYLPQDVELLSGTIAANISRFGDRDSKKIVEAAKRANAHDMILALPDGYETRIGEGGRLLSGGQRQRIALARALYGDTRLIVLDEPNANLDGEGEGALRQTLIGLRGEGRTVIVITHKPALLGVVDKILMLRDGTVGIFGPRDDVFAKLKRMTPMPAGRGPLVAAQGP